MSRGSLSDAVRAAGYAMAMSDELLGFPELKVMTKIKELAPREPEAKPAAAAAPNDGSKGVRTFFTSWTAWA